MRAIASRPSRLDLAWFGFALANLAAMVVWPREETIPFHLIWISLTLLYGFRVWRPATTGLVLGFVAVSTGLLIAHDAFGAIQTWGELFEVPLMSAMFLAMVWHARRRQDALGALEAKNVELGALLERQERLLHDVSHELRTPVQIARGHLELLRRADGAGEQELDVALDELGRVERIVERILLLAKAEDGQELARTRIDVEELLELIEPHFPRTDTLVADLGAVIGTHAGPRVIGLAFCVPG